MCAAIACANTVNGATYSVGSSSNASVVIYPSPTPNGIGLTGQYYKNSNTNYTNSANFNPTNLTMTRMDSVIDFITSSPLARS